MLARIFSYNKLKHFLIFPRKQILTFHADCLHWKYYYANSLQYANCLQWRQLHGMSGPVLKKNKKNIIDFSSAVFAYIAVKVRNLIKPVQILSQPVAFLFQVLSTSWPNSGQVW